MVTSSSKVTFGCQPSTSAALLASDAEFKVFYEQYHQLAPQIYGSIYD